MKTRSIILFSIVFIIFFFTGATFSQDKPFQPGEKMVFQVRWGVILAGEATLEFLPYEEFAGVEASHFLFSARTSPFVDVFYKVRDRIESYTDRDFTRSLFYYKEHKGKSEKEIRVAFDWDENLARYTDAGGEREPVSIMPNTFDPLSVFYAFRLYLREDNSDSKIHVSDGKKCIIGSAKIIKKEKIRVAGNEYNTLLVEPEMENVGGVFEKSRGAKLKIWVTDDELRIPVRIRSKVTVGSFTADLVSYSNGYETSLDKQ